MTELKRDRSRTLQARAERSIVGGVNSPARAFMSVGGDPLFIERAEGCHIWDADGNRYIDFIGSWGPMIMGHAHPVILQAVSETAARGVSFGASTSLEIDLAEKIRAMMPSIELLRMVNSGTEATMSAVRLARGFTRRNKIIKFAGCYHGHGDSFLIKAGSGALTHGIPGSAGITPGTAADTLVAEYNDHDGVDALVQKFPGDIAAIVVEPVVGNMGVVPPRTGFLAGLREIADAHGIVLIFDEVMTGFRLARGGAQELYGVTPDLTTFGKIVGGGLPVGAYGGRREIMEHLAPLGPVYQAGTLSGNPLAMAAGLAALSLIDIPETWMKLDTAGLRLEAAFDRAAVETGVPLTVNRVGSMITPFFTSGPVIDYPGASVSDTARFSRFFKGLLDRGVLWPPSQFEAGFLSLAHDEEAMDAAIEAIGETFRELAI